MVKHAVCASSDQPSLPLGGGRRCADHVHRGSQGRQQWTWVTLTCLPSSTRQRCAFALHPFHAVGSFKFARGRLLHLSTQERYKEECQHVFDLQNKVLASTEVLSTDEESSDEEGSEDELAKNLGGYINKKSTQQMSYEEEEMERADLIRRLMVEDKKAEGSEGKTGTDTPRSGEACLMTCDVM